MASDSDSASSVEDETQRQRLLDAAIDINTIIPLVGPKAGPAGIQSAVSRNRIIPNIPSKRPQTIEHEDKNDLNTTPEFKTFVAKKLSQMLDQEVEEHKMENRNLNTADYEDTGIRLCFGSNHHLKTDCNPADVPKQRRPAPRKRAQASSSDSSEEDERLAAAAVSHDFIIKQSKVSIGSQDDRSVVIEGTEAKSHQNGKDSVSNSEGKDFDRNPTEDCIEGDSSKTKQKKKKKKNKKQKNIKEN